jgi:DNA-binding GntR family transcriptional regulator
MLYFNELAPGQKLVYQDLAKKLNVSITPVVQALKGLQRSNLVRYEPNRGYFVGEITESETKELYQAREALEIYAVPMVLSNLNTENIKSIKLALKEYNEATLPEERRTLMIRDAHFHLKIIEHAGNTVIRDILRDLFEKIYLRYRAEYLWEARIKEATEEHRAILELLSKGDAEGVKSALRQHIRKGMNQILRNLSRNGRVFF